MLLELKKELGKNANSTKKEILQRFFKTKKGEYAQGDIFLGIVVPVQRKIAKKFQNLSINDTIKLLQSKIHEHRLTALFILVDKFKNSSTKEKKQIFQLYLKNTKYINNWDLVDLSAPNIVGFYLLDKDRKILYKLAKSNDLWKRRISILSTFTFIRNHDFDDALKISELLLIDKHDLIHKAVGWMLREIGKKDKSKLIEFLDKHNKTMPRTMLRYSIEKLNQKEKDFYMRKA